jgi:hypothetical protein
MLVWFSTSSLDSKGTIVFWCHGFMGTMLVRGVQQAAILKIGPEKIG